MTTPILWGRGSSSNVQRVLWTLAEAGLNPEHRIVGGAHGGLDTPEFAALSPAGTIPVLQDGEVVIWQTHAAMRHVALAHAPHLFPSTPLERAQVDSWMDWSATVAWPPIRDLYAHGWLGRPGDPDALRRAINLAAIRADAVLAGRPWLTGDAFTLADVTLGIAFNRFRSMGEAVTWPHVARWLDTARARPAFAVVEDVLPPRPDPTEGSAS
ncbi:MAG: glutathione S-transferase family protein [Pseudomonadota bacterium]